MTLFCLCENSVRNENTGISVGIKDKIHPFFYNDSLFDDWIFPSAHVCDTQNGIIVTMFPGGHDDYTCTYLPDTVWAIFKYNLFRPDTFICFSDTCWALNDTFFYSLVNYFNDKWIYI